MKKLPARELAKIRRALASIEKSKEVLRPRRKSPKRKRATSKMWAGLAEWSKEIFGDRVIPNEVLREREESPW